MLRPAVRNVSAALLGLIVGAVLAFGGAAWRLSQGPIAVDALKPGIERWIATGMGGGRAHVGAANLVWFGKARSLGLQLADVSLVDARGRQVLQARQVDAGLALESLLRFEPALGHVAARRFFAAVSMSPQGRYGLGYDTAGAPGRGSDLWRLFDDMIGRPRQGRPLSFLREIDFADGVVDFRQVGGPVAWRGRVGTLQFSKADGRLNADIDVGVADAALKARGRADVGLKRAHVEASVANLDPAKVFPWSGPTEQLSMLDALVQGRGSLTWAADRGVRAADVHLTAGAGRMRVAGTAEPFYAGELLAAFDPSTARVQIQRASAAGGRGELNVTGQVWLTPESRQTGPARLEVALNAPHGRLALAAGAEPQSIDAFLARGRYIPQKSRIEIDGVRAVVAGAPFSVAGVLQRPNDLSSWGVDLEGRVDGEMAVSQVVAIWPDGFDQGSRNWVRDHVPSGRLGQVVLAIHTPPVAAGRSRPVSNQDLRMAFVFEDAQIVVDSDIPAIEHAHGTGLLQGDRFQIAMPSATMQDLGLSEGSFEIPHLTGPNRRIRIEARAGGDARELLGIVDRTTSGMATAHGFAPQRLSGQADVAFSIGRPFEIARAQDYDVGYAGVVRNATLTGAVLGLTLTSPEVSLQGGLDRVSAHGDVGLGPYRGPLQYLSSFPRGGAGRQQATLNGVVDASTLGLSGPSGSTMRFAAQFDGAGDAGHGVIRSKGFDGQAAWRLGQEGSFTLQGVTDTGALRAIGAPVGKGVPLRVPTRLTLTRSGTVWTGALDADAYSGTVTLASDVNRHLRYAADLTPTEAQKLGVTLPGGVGRSTPLAVDIAMNGDAGALAYTVGTWLGQVSWSKSLGARTQYHWRTTFSPADLHAMGLPASIEPRGPIAVGVTLSSAGEGWTGVAEAAGSSLKFTASPPIDGRRRLVLSGAVDGASLSSLGLGPSDMISGPSAVSASFDLGPDGVRAGHVDADLQRASVSAPFVVWNKPSGRAMQLSADFARHADGGIELTAIKGQGPGFGFAGSGLWRPKAGATLQVSAAKLEGAFDGSLDLAMDADGDHLTTRARFLDARRMLTQSRALGASASGAPGAAPVQPLHIDAQVAEVRLSDQGVIRNVRVTGEWGTGDHRRLEATISRDDGVALVSVRLSPDATGVVLQGQISDVGESAAALFGVQHLKGGRGTINGRLVDGGMDLHLDLTKVRVVQASVLARILTLGSLHATSDMLNGAGIEFTNVVAPVSLRGSKLTIGRARATGPAMGVTTSGVVDLDSRTIDLSGGIAPSYVLNSALGAVPLVGDLLVSHKGEGMFGLTYSARGAFASPRIKVNPFSLATPGILRRIFEGHSAAEKISQGEDVAGG